ncbi:MAG: YifB family Mg chelatase-like AAA ATPase [Proteobacteria bacterium]|nr:YifB family Mg chelatase-like AAA ATPase [Pseudomonadota bacterium]
MYAHINTASIDHLAAKQIKVEVASYNGLPGIKITGLPDNIVKESFYRISTAFKACKIDMPLKRFVINFIPADVPKKGSGFDLPIAAALLTSIGVIPKDALARHLLYGELSLTGEVRPVSGVLPIVNFAQKNFDKVIIPYLNLNEVCFFRDRTVPVKHLDDLINFAVTGNIDAKAKIEDAENTTIENNLERKTFTHYKDFSDVIGQPVAVRCAEISVAGKHHILLIGSPGCGKSMIGERIAGIMPPLTKQDKLEVNSIYSIAGLLGDSNNIIDDPPYRSPHHTITDSALIGGTRIGEITLAHKGVLFLDELSEFKHNVLNALREPLEKGTIDISRSSYCHKMPADFLLIAASNPCNCWNYLKKDSSCNCSSLSMERFKRRLNGPLMDRFDIKLVMTVPKVTTDEFCTNNPENKNSSARIKERILNSIRFREEIKQKGIKQKITDSARNILDKHMSTGTLSLRNLRKAINVAKTIASLEQSTNIEENHILESINYTRPILTQNSNITA